MNRESPFQYRYNTLYAMAWHDNWTELWFSDNEDAAKALEALALAKRFFERGKIKAAHNVLDQLDDIIGVSTYPHVEEEQ